MLQELELMRSDLVAVPVELGWQLMQRPEQPDVLLGVARDISERRLAAEQLERMAHYDSLTGLPNRTLFFRTLENAVALAPEQDQCLVVMFIALDRFKSVNDTLGSLHGDELLRQFANRLMQCVRLRDTVGRLGGDEFALILSAPREQLDPVQTVHDVRCAAPSVRTRGAPRRTQRQHRHRHVSRRCHRGAGAGAVCRHRHGACAGRPRWLPLLHGRHECAGAARLDSSWRCAARWIRSSCCCTTSPRSARYGRTGGAEALLRWQRPDYGLVYPAEFVSVLEDTGLIVRVGAWIIDAACRQIGLWLRNGVGAVRVAVNVASRQFVEGDLAQIVQTALQRHGVPPELLELELTKPR
jgi:diguanylate cyclase (GGDEF)-like protein